MRSLNARIFEAIKLLQDYKKIIRREGDTDRIAKFDEYAATIGELEKDPSYLLAKTIRDYATNHYLPSKKNIPHVSERAKFVAYLHENSGNSYYPFGEEFVFLALIGRYFDKHGQSEYSMKDLRNWIDWGLKASRFISKTL